MKVEVGGRVIRKLCTKLEVKRSTTNKANASMTESSVMSAFQLITSWKKTNPKYCQRLIKTGSSSSE